MWGEGEAALFWLGVDSERLDYPDSKLDLELENIQWNPTADIPDDRPHFTSFAEDGDWWCYGTGDA